MLAAPLRPVCLKNDKRDSNADALKLLTGQGLTKIGQNEPSLGLLTRLPLKM
jgi:hypothetical protein